MNTLNNAFVDWLTSVPTLFIMLICDLAVGIVYLAISFIREYIYYHRGPRK